jgi:hypothetical protein
MDVLIDIVDGNICSVEDRKRRGGEIKREGWGNGCRERDQ